ncbi:MAG TPA: prepilin-type N-terminal cleavage/methylation domain-containing protein [Tepidisphaeraceae bacterium]|nr:prepilin-type N-terminal cleavage/methylation domain-containing protein [Tepidisphaeraceae bacterium]
MTPRRRHHGFSLIELMIVIAILVVLLGLSFVGYKVLGTHGKTTTTQTTLESCKSLVTEVEVAGGLPQVQANYTSGFPPLVSGVSPVPIAAPLDTGNNNGNITADAYSSTHTIRYTAPAIVATQNVMRALISNPKNNTILAQLPGERFLKKPDGTLPTTGIAFNTPAPPGNGQPKYPILLDGWGNPIIYVPAAGMSGVTVAGLTNRIVTSGGILATNYGAGQSFPAGATGFWASAGPDGDFTTGDDNVYSFEN